MTDEYRQKREPLVPMTPDNTFEEDAPTLQRLRNVLFAGSLVARASERFAGNDPISPVAGPRDKEREDFTARDLREDERADRQRWIATKEFRVCRSEIAHDAIALNR